MSIKQITSACQELLALSHLYLAINTVGNSLMLHIKVNKNPDISKYPFEMIWGMIFFLFSSPKRMTYPHHFSLPDLFINHADTNIYFH